MSGRGWVVACTWLAAFGIALSACGAPPATNAPPTRAGAECNGAATPAQTEGPYYRAGAPEVSSLVDETTRGERLMLTGQVLTTDCEPLAGAVLDIWQADASGAYDNNGYHLRGRAVADSDGRYAIETIVPGPYPGRTPHIHLKVLDADGQERLTTQIYLTGVSDQTPDTIFDPVLLARDLPADSQGRRVVAFDVVVPR